MLNGTSEQTAPRLLWRLGLALVYLPRLGLDRHACSAAWPSVLPLYSMCVYDYTMNRVSQWIPPPA